MYKVQYFVADFDYHLGMLKSAFKTMGSTNVS